MRFGELKQEDRNRKQWEEIKMNDSKFGGWYPPGVHNLPCEEVYPCEICGGIPENDECICPECPVCGSIGHLLCYREHGLVRSKEQIGQLAKKEKEWEEHKKKEQEYYEKWLNDRDDIYVKEEEEDD
jgi:hypothetical protein